MAQGMVAFPLYNISATSFADEKNSLLYGLLPKIVRSRLRRLPSLRHSISQYAIGSYDVSPSDSRRSSRGCSDLPTPPPGYRSRVSPSETVSDSEDLDYDTLIRPLSSCSVEVDRESGIMWRFANQGLNLLNLAASEDSKRPQNSRGSSSSSSSLSRQLYVHGVTYLLRGLPSDLTTNEKCSVWAAIPEGVQQISPHSTSSSLICTATNKPDTTETKEIPSLLQRTVATVIVQAFILFQFLLPYLRFCLRYEREHRISERVVASSIQNCEGLVNTANRVCKMHDGQVGQAVNDAAVWWIKGVMGGIQQGVGDGLIVLGVDTRDESRKT